MLVLSEHDAVLKNIDIRLVWIIDIFDVTILGFFAV